MVLLTVDVNWLYIYYPKLIYNITNASFTIILLLLLGYTHVDLIATMFYLLELTYFRQCTHTKYKILDYLRNKKMGNYRSFLTRL